MKQEGNAEIYGIRKYKEMYEWYRKKQRRKEVVKKYESKFDRINCRLKECTIKRIEALGYSSVNSFICLAVSDKLEREESILNTTKNGTNK